MAYLDDRRESIIRARSANQPGGMISSTEAQRRIAAENIAYEAARSSGGGSPSRIMPTPPAPKPRFNPFESVVKLPNRDVVSLLDNNLNKEVIQNLLFENIGANELTQFTRHDTVEGINPYYNTISNLSEIKRKYDPSALISVQKADASYFNIYTIRLDQKIPDDKYLEDNNLTDYVYINSNGDLIIELVNLKEDERVEVQIDTNGTIYEMEA